jgi:hypothetical protein
MTEPCTGKRRVGRIKKGTRSLARRHIVGVQGSHFKAGRGGNGGIDLWEGVRDRPGDDVSILLLAIGSTTMRQVSIQCLLLSENLLLRLKPVIKWTLTDTSFVNRKGSCGDSFMECC